MYNILFSYGSRVDLGPCVVTAQDDTTMESYYNSTESGYVDFSTLDITVGERIYVNQDGYNILFGRINAISSTVITLSQNPGQIIHNKILNQGFIKPFVKRTPYLYSYPCSSYCGASLTKKGNSYYTFEETVPHLNHATLVETDSVLSFYFKKGNNIDEVQVVVKNGSEASVIKEFNKLLRRPNDISFNSEINKVSKDVIGINSISAANKTNLY